MPAKRQPSAAKRSASGASTGSEVGLDAQLLDWSSYRLISKYLDSERAEDADASWKELHELPLYEKALSSSPSIPETIRKRVQLATFCHDVFGKQEDKALASASQRFEGDQIIPEEFDRHDGFWDLALELRTQAMLAAIKSAEGGRNGPADMDSIGPIDEASALDESAPIDVRRRSQFMDDAKERKDEFTKEAPDWIKLSHTYKWPAFALSMRNYLKQVSQHYPLPTLAEAVDSQGVGAWSPDASQAASTPTKALPGPSKLGQAAKASAPVKPPASKAPASKPPAKAAHKPQPAVGSQKTSSRSGTGSSARQEEPPAVDSDDDGEDLNEDIQNQEENPNQDEDDFLALLAKINREDEEAKKKAKSAKNDPPRKPLETAASRSPVKSAMKQSSNGRASIPRENLNKRPKLYFEDDTEGEKVSFDSDEEDAPPRKQKRIDDSKEDDNRSQRSNSVFHMPPIKMQEIGPLRTQKDVKQETGVKAAKGSRQRNPWSAEEVKALEDGLEEVGMPAGSRSNWVKILDLYGPKGSESTVLANRSHVDLKDKARNERNRREKAGLPLGIFELVKGYN